MIDELAGIVGPDHVDSGGDIKEDDTHDEALTGRPVRTTGGRASGVHRRGRGHRQVGWRRGDPAHPARSGTGLSGGSIPAADGVVVSFERMCRIIEIDTANHVAVVEPGVTLAELDAALVPHGLIYPVFPGEQSGRLGGNVATNAGGMRAVKYGVTRHHVLGSRRSSVPVR